MNFYSMVTPCGEGVPCSEQDYEQISAALAEEASGFQVALQDSLRSPTGLRLYLFAEGPFQPEEMRKSLWLISDLIERAQLPFLEFGYAHYGDKPRMGTADGGRFRIYANGKICFAKLHWPAKGQFSRLLRFMRVTR